MAKENNLQGAFCHTDPSLFRIVKSYLSGRTVCINDSPDKFLVLPPFCIQRLADAMSEYRAAEPYIFSPSKKQIRCSKRVKELIATVEASIDRSTYCAALDGLFSEMKEGWSVSPSDRQHYLTSGYRVYDRKYVLILCMHMKRQQLITFPMLPLFFNAYYPTDILPKPIQSLTQNLRPHFVLHFRRFVWTSVGIEDVGDLVPDVIANFLSASTTGDTTSSYVNRGIARAIHKIQVATYVPENVVHKLTDFCAMDRDACRSRGGTDFAWAVKMDAGLETWRSLGTAWLGQQRASIRSRQICINALFDWLIENPEIPREPTALLNRNAKYFEISLKGENRIYCAEFFDWLLATQFVDEDDDGNPLPFPGLHNPIVRNGLETKLRQGQSLRERMPALLVDQAIAILTEGDWAWAKQAGKAAGGGGGDYFQWFDSKTEQLIEMWSPVRAVVIWLKLKMLFRTMQVRFLDSGEADTYRYDVGTKRMIINRGPIASGTTALPVAKGVLQTVDDERADVEHPILRISTNKTADIGKEAWAKGYDCPYAPQEVIASLDWLRSWQESNNPVHEPSLWIEINEIIETKTPQQVIGMSSTFLMRDPCALNPAHPITDGRIQKMWVKLMDELERRLEKQGILDISTRLPFQLIDRRKANGIPLRSIYDLHSMRLTNISAMYERGIPIEIVMRVAGHGTTAMTLRYTKIGVGAISELMNEFELKRIQHKQQEWVRFNRDRAYKNLTPLVSFNSEDGVNAFVKGSGASIVFMDIGICPVACSQCNVGGDIVRKMGPNKTYNPVPGGRCNCASCRFFISGPPFLHGLVAAFNAKSKTASDLALHRLLVQEKYEELKFEKHESDRVGNIFDKLRELIQADTAFEQSTELLDQVLLQMSPLARAILQSLKLLDESLTDATNPLALMVNDFDSASGALEIAYENTTEFDLVDRICQSSVFFSSIDAGPANVTRMRQYDRMLKRESVNFDFLDFDHQTGLQVGNNLSKLLNMRIGRENTLKLIEGTETLVRLGFAPKDLLGQLREMSGKKVSVTGNPARGVLTSNSQLTN